jgi:hypothetical protein
LLSSVVSLIVIVCHSKAEQGLRTLAPENGVVITRERIALGECIERKHADDVGSPKASPMVGGRPLTFLVCSLWPWLWAHVSHHHDSKHVGCYVRPWHDPRPWLWRAKPLCHLLYDLSHPVDIVLVNSLHAALIACVNLYLHVFWGIIAFRGWDMVGFCM